MGSAEEDGRPDDVRLDGVGSNGHPAPVTTPWTAPDWSPPAEAGPAPAFTDPPAFTDAPAFTDVPATAGPAVNGAAHPGAVRAPTGWPEVRERRSHRWGLGAYLVVEVIFLGSSVSLGLLLAGGGLPAAVALVLGLAVPTVLAAGTAVLITVLRGNGPRIDLGLEWSWRDVGRGLAFGFGGLLITIPASALYLAIAGEGTTSAVGEAFGDVRSGPVLAVVVLLVVVVVAPLCEEIVYRGLLWGGVERLGAGRWVTFGVTTLLFALAHFEFARTPLLLVVALPIAFARLYTGRLPASVVAHAVNNLLPGVSLMLMLLGVLPSG